VPDVVIAGYGPAGAAAAIAAHDAGRSVLILESAERGGGNARYSGGFLFDVPDDAAIAHLDALCFGRTDRAVLEAYAAGLHELDGWLCSLGGTTAPFEPPPARLPAPFPSWPHLPAGQRIRYRTVAGGPGRRGEALWDLLDAAVRARGIDVRYRTAAERLLPGADGAMTGMAAGGAEEPAAGGVILACGGFEANPVLAEAYLPYGPEELAGQMGVDPAVLAATLEQYNKSARAGRDEAFGRSADTLVPLDFGRLYAIKTWPGIAGTTGGPRHDERARVLRPDGRPVPGLYAAGAVSLAWGHLIEHGGGLTDAMVFGRIAGAEAASRAGLAGA
jgi:hypothetical protein